MNEKKQSLKKDTEQDSTPSVEKKGGFACVPKMEKEIGGYENMLEPTRYGDWETNGRCTDF